MSRAHTTSPITGGPCGRLHWPVSRALTLVLCTDLGDLEYPLRHYIRQRAPTPGRHSSRLPLTVIWKYATAIGLLLV